MGRVRSLLGITSSQLSLHIRTQMPLNPPAVEIVVECENRGRTWKRREVEAVITSIKTTIQKDTQEALDLARSLLLKYNE